MNPDELKMLEMRDYLTRIQTEFDAWSSKIGKESDKLVDEHQKRTAESREQIDALKEREAKAKAAVEGVQADIEKENQEIDRALAAINSLKAEGQKIPKSADELRKQLDELRATAAQRGIQLQEKEAEQRRHAAELEKGAKYYSDRLGFKFFRIEGYRSSIMFAFTQIDPADPDREFSFSVTVNSANMYMFEECKPRVDGSSDLLAKLNGTNNFSNFVIDMRKKFCEFVANEK